MKFTTLLIAFLLLIVPASFAATVIIPQSSEPTKVTIPGTYVIQHSDINTKGLDTRSLTIPGKSDTAAILDLLKQRKAQRNAQGFADTGYATTDITYTSPGPQVQNQDQMGYGNGQYYFPNMNQQGYGLNNNFHGTYESCDIEFASAPYVYGLGFPFSYSFSSALYGRRPYLGNGCNGINERNTIGYGGYQWYRFANSTYTQCTTNDDFNRYDCSYRFDGRSYFYDNPVANDLYYNTQFDSSKIDISDRFALINGKYVLCPQRAFDHDECVFYYKGGKWYYDDPSDNDFSGIPNIEMNTDLDKAMPTNNTNNQSNQSNQNNQSNQTNNSILPAGYVNYKAYVDQFPKFNYVNGNFVSCTSTCTYYRRDGIMFTIDQSRYAQG